MYHDINGKNLDKIPVRAIQLTDRQIDSLMNLVSDKIKRFEWEEITEPRRAGIKNCLGSRLFKGCSPLQLLCNLIGNRPQSATFHTAKR